MELLVFLVIIVSLIEAGYGWVVVGITALLVVLILGIFWIMNKGGKNGNS